MVIIVVEEVQETVLAEEWAAQRRTTKRSQAAGRAVQFQTLTG